MVSPGEWLCSARRAAFGQFVIIWFAVSRMTGLSRYCRISGHESSSTWWESTSTMK